MNMQRRIASALATPLVLGLLLAGSPAIQAAPAAGKAEPAPKSTQSLRLASSYTVSSAPADHLYMDPPKLPDLSGYTTRPCWRRSSTSRAGGPPCGASSSRTP